MLTLSEVMWTLQEMWGQVSRRNGLHSTLKQQDLVAEGKGLLSERPGL